jgi:hypothetical protein
MAYFNPYRYNPQQQQQSNPSTGMVDVDSAYKSATSAVGSIPVVGGVISGLIGVGDSIGDPIRAASEEKDANGNLKDYKAAETAAAVGFVTNPFKAGLEQMNNPYASDFEKVMAFTGLGGIFGGQSYMEMLTHKDPVAPIQNLSIEQQQLQATPSSAVRNKLMADPRKANTYKNVYLTER